MNKVALFGAVVFLVASLAVETHGSIEALKAKLRHRFPGLNHRAAGYGGGYGGGYYGGGGSAASSAASAANGGYGGSASSAAAASAAGASRAPAYGYDTYEPAYVEPVAVRRPVAGYGSSAAAAASAAAGAGSTPPIPVAPVKPGINLDTYRRPIVSAYRAHTPRFVASRPVYGGAGAAASAASAAGAGAGGYGGAAAGAAAAANAGGYTGGQTVSSATGAYAGTDNGRESSAYKRSTENIQNHEDGHVDDNHYYNAQSYGKTEDEKLHEAYNNNDEDVEQTPTLYRSKKSGENYVMDYNKARRESGSGVLASDKHSSAFNKNSKRLIENVDRSHTREGDGIIEDVNVVSATDLDDADEEIYDSDGLHGGAAGAGAAAAASAAGGAGGRGFGGSAASSAAAATAANRARYI